MHHPARIFILSFLIAASPVAATDAAIPARPKPDSKAPQAAQATARQGKLDKLKSERDAQAEKLTYEAQMGALADLASYASLGLVLFGAGATTVAKLEESPGALAGYLLGASCMSIGCALGLASWVSTLFIHVDEEEAHWKEKQKRFDDEAMRY